MEVVVGVMESITRTRTRRLGGTRSRPESAADHRRGGPEQELVCQRSSRASVPGPAGVAADLNGSVNGKWIKDYL